MRCGFLSVLSLLALLAAAEFSPSQSELSCDDILRFAYPDLCELEVRRGTILIRNLSLVYWRYRNKQGSSDKVPVLMVHGGPAWSHEYIINMKQQACRGREVAFYDQVGAGESSKPANVSETAPWLLTIPYYNEEVNALLAEFRWPAFHFFGSSWGTVIGQSYGLSQDSRLKSIVLQGPLSDGQLYLKSQWDQTQGNLGSLPLHVQAALHMLESKQAYSSTMYSKEDEVLTYFFTSRTIPSPDCLVKSDPTSPTSRDIYVKMQGASEFTTGGVLAKMNFTPHLHKIEVPVLLIHGRYDTMRPPVIDAMYRSLPRVWRAHMPRSGHVTMIDDPLLTNDVTGDFYKHADRGTLDSFAIPEDAKDPGDVPLTIMLSAEPLPARTSSWPRVDSSFLLGAVVGGVVGAASVLVLVSGTSRSSRRTEMLAEPLTSSQA